MATDVANNGSEGATELVPISGKQRGEIARIESIVAECGMQALVDLGEFERMLKLAAGMRALQAALTPELMRDVMSLQGSRLGFKTDKDRDGGYALDVVKPCFIEALMFGARPVGNEFNIIAKNAYFTKEFYTRMLDDLPGLSYVSKPGDVAMGPDGTVAKVQFVVEWIYNGRRGSLERLGPYTVKRESDGAELRKDDRIIVRVNKGMAEDGVLGKATRKMFKQVYEQLTRFNLPDGEVDDVVDVKSKPAAGSLSELTDRLTGESSSSDSGSGSDGGSSGYTTDAPADPVIEGEFLRTLEWLAGFEALSKIPEERFKAKEKYPPSYHERIDRAFAARADELRAAHKARQTNGGAS